MREKEDLRVKKTKHALNTAFAELIKEKSFEDISINELCTKAGVRRATFYKHYKDKYDFVSGYIGFLRNTFDKRPTTVSHLDDAVSYYVNYAKRVVEYININEKLINSLLASSLIHIIIGLIAEKNFNDTREKLQANVASGMKLPASVDAVAAMLTGGIETMILNWLKEGKKQSVEELTAEAETLVRCILRSAQQG